ncbi:MAG: hypothetical protein AB8F74_10140 [Saprospiraceae bacterium]
MNSANDLIIDSTFAAILLELEEHSPERTFFNSMKAANLPIDKRMLANFIIQDFPWPIGVELRRLFSGDRIKRNEQRVEQIFIIAERTAQIVSFCFMAQYWNEQRKKAFDFSIDFQAQVNGFRRPSFGVYIGAFRAIYNQLKERGISPFLEIDDRKGERILKLYNDFVEKRNDVQHQKGKTSCEELENMLVELLKELAFLVKYKLVTIKEIKVVNPLFKPVSFKHTISLLNSQHEDFNAVEQNFDFYFDSHSVLMLHGSNFQGSHLNLSPFIIDTGSVLENQQVANIKNGIYILNEIRSNKSIYTFTNAREQVSFKGITGFEEIENQLEKFKQFLFRKDVASE